MIDPAEGNARRGVVEWLSGFVRSDNTGGVFYGWRLVVIGFLVILVGREIGDGLIGAVWGSRAYQGEGIGPPWVILVIAAYALGGLASLWFAGWGADRLGPRWMARLGLPLVGLIALLAVIPAPYILEVAIAGLGALGIIGAYVPAVTMLNHWFRERLALALALTLFGVAIVGVAVGPMLSLLLLIVGWVAGWRLLTAVCGVAIVAAAWPLARAIRNRPEDWGEHPDGLVPAASVPDYSWRDAMRSRQFWTLVAAGCCVAVAETVAGVYDGPIISQGGATFDAIDKAGLFQEYASVAGILAGGLASYRFSVRRVLSAAAIAQAVGTVLLLSGFGTVFLETTILLGAASGMATAPAIAAVGVYFGRRSFGLITVTTFLINQVVSSAALAGAGYTFSVVGGYVPVFVAAGIVSVVGAGLYLALGNPRLSLSQQIENPAIS